MNQSTGALLLNEIAPRLQTSIPRLNMVGCDDTEELVQDAIAMAARMLTNVERSGKKVTPGNIAYYTLLHVKSGRRSTGTSNVDVMHPTTQLNGRARVASFEEVISHDELTGETVTLGDLMANDCDDPSATAARKMDWEEFLGSQGEIERELLSRTLEGFTLREVAQLFGLSDSGIQLHKKRVASAARQFLGENILTDMNERPQWKTNLHAWHEKQACRGDRKAA